MLRALAVIGIVVASVLALVVLVLVVWFLKDRPKDKFIQEFYAEYGFEPHWFNMNVKDELKRLRNERNKEPDATNQGAS